MNDAEIAAELTSIYRTPNGTMALRPLQGRILLGAEIAGGCFSNASVGLGKSLALAMLMTICGGKRPLVFTESNNIPQMRSDLEQYRLHFQIPTYYRLEPYERLGTVSGSRMLDDLKPTFVGLDEAHKVKRVLESARAKRLDRWRLANPDVPVAALSGSPGTELAEYAHLICWAVPAARSDRGGQIPVSPEGRPEGQEFRKFLKRLDEDDSFREAFWTWLRALPGVVISAETFTDIPLRIKHTVLPTPAELDPHWERLRRFGEAPDGWPLDEGPGEQWLLARQLSNDMYYEHVPRPPFDWKMARKAWYRFCRELIEAGADAPGGPWDTEGQISRGVIGGELPREAYDQWMQIKDSYAPVIRPAWLGKHALEYAAEWGRRSAALSGPRSGGSIIWVEPIGVGEELARMTGWPYYGPGARNSRGQHVSQADKTGPAVIICSVKSCGTGKNLQHRYSRNLFLVPPSNNDAAEQWIGRTHRSGQLEDCVEAEFLYGCLEDWTAVHKSMAQARVAEQDLTAPRKMLLAQHTWAIHPGKAGGFAWIHANDVGPVVIRTDTTNDGELTT